MSAVPINSTMLADLASWQFCSMQERDIGEVLVVEEDSYPYPWTRGNFLDSLKSGYQAYVLRNEKGELTGYFLMMNAVDEAHLLNITVAAFVQRRGIGRLLLDKATHLARQQGMHSMLLEVRPSNVRALHIYQRYGFTQIGLRKNYYPAAGHTREDAIVMRLAL